MGSRAGGPVQIVCGHQSANESTHIAICVQKVASKTRGGMSKILTKMWRSIAVHLKLPSFIFWTFLWWARCTEHQQQWHNICYQKEPNREPDERCNNFCDTSSAQSSILWLTSSKFREFWNTKSTKARFKMADNLTKRDLWRARLSLSRTTCGGYLPVSTHRRCYPQPSWMLLHYKP